MSESAECELAQIFPVSISGEWGGEPLDGGNSLVIRAADFTKDCKLRPVIGAARHIPQEKLGMRVLKDGDILIEKSGGSPDQPVGRVAFFDRSIEGQIYTHSNFLQLLRVAEGFDKKFSFYLMAFLYSSGLVYRYQQQTTGIINLKLEHYLREKVQVPSSPKVQERIQRILTVADRAIEKTEALIEKYQQIKAGLMHDLFTRGITADSKLRPTREQAPELYQETPIGWIPKDWNNDFLEKLLAPIPNNLRSGPFGSALLKSELVEEGIPFLGIDNIHVEKFVGKYRRFVSDKKFNELIKYAVRPKDIVITIMGTVGRCSLIPDEIGRALSSKHLWTMSIDQSVVIPELICWQLNYASWVQAWFRRETQGGIMDAIQSKTLKTLRLPVPPMAEQEKILERYEAISSKIQMESDNLDKLKKEKSGLMHDLLTGEVPVTIDEPEAAHV